MEIIIKGDDSLNEPISAFAYNMGRVVEEFIRKRNDDLNNKNNLLEAEMLSFRTMKSGLINKAFKAGWNSAKMHSYEQNGTYQEDLKKFKKSLK
jgi:hypothetical protein